MNKEQNAQSLEDRCEALAPGSPKFVFFPWHGEKYERCTLVKGHECQHWGNKEKRW